MIRLQVAFFLSSYLGQPFDHEDIGPVPGRMHPVFNVMPLVQVERREPGILMEPARVFATAAFGSHDRPQFVALCRRQPDLVVKRILEQYIAIKL